MSKKPESAPMSEYAGATLDELPKTNPPRSYDDVKPYWGQVEGAQLFTVNQLVLETPELLDLWKTLVAAAHENPLAEVDGTAIRRVADGDEINRQIREKRARYDKEREAFHRLVNGEVKYTVYPSTTSYYMERENIGWDEDWVQENYPSQS